MALDKLAVFSRRQPGERRIVELAAGEGEQASLLVEFEIPTPLQLARIEAEGMNAIRDLRRGQFSLRRYGLPDGQLTDGEIEGLAVFITAVESARVLWRDWNYAKEPPAGEQPVKAPLDLEHIVEVLSVPHFRSAWNIHLDMASPLERAEGNGSGASPNTSSDVTAEAPTTATGADESTPPAPVASLAEPDGSAPESSSPPEPPKAG